MLICKAMEDKAAQEALCKLCGAEYDPDLLAYSAYEDENPIGICQFRYAPGYAWITDLRSLPTVNDFEGMFILARGTLNFIDLCGTHKAKCPESAGDLTLLKAVGFSETEPGIYEMDLTDAFSGHCQTCNS